MVSGKTTRLLALIAANALLTLAVLVFASGFFPYKPVLPGLASLPETSEATAHNAPFKRVIFMVVDALRTDFVYGADSHMAFTQSLIRDGAAIPFTAHATPPTVTMPRVKALTTGSVPSFLDLILNFAEADTSSSLSGQDTWLAQLRARKSRGIGASAGAASMDREVESGGLVFYGDDTWLKLFPQSPPSDNTAPEPFFKRSDGTSSFFVSDFTQVDNNVTRHLPHELRQADWDGMIMHYLGLDHIGHKTGPSGPAMAPKQREMDAIVETIYRAMETEPHQQDTLLVLAGDHGMNAGGNHGGSGPGETEPALVFASPKFKTFRGKEVYECPTLPKAGTEFHFYRKVEQSDLVPSLAGLLGLPVSRNSLGVLVSELLGFWREKEALELLEGNARQVLGIVEAAFGVGVWGAEVEGWKGKVCREGLSASLGASGVLGELAYKWAVAEVALERGEGAREKLLEFLYAAQEEMSSTASSYDIPRMVAGMTLIFVALAATLAACPSLWPPTPSTIFLSVTVLLYGIMMFASSYVEEEQQFWYWITPAWLLYLTLARLRVAPKDKTLRTLLIGASLLSLHRLSIRWNQTGQKHAGEPDIVYHFFPSHHMLMWTLVLAAYGYNSRQIARYSFSEILPPGFSASLAAMLFVPAVIFKLNFTQADAPELVQELGKQLREWTEGFNLVTQARVVFALSGMVTVLVMVLPQMLKRLSVTSSAGGGEGQKGVGLAERLHPLLTLFLMTQTRAPNVPLFLALDAMRQLLGELLAWPEDQSGRRRGKAVSVATSALLLSNVYYFCMGGSNSISSIDLSNAYNGVADYNIVAVGVLLFASNWAGPVWWCSTAVLLLSQEPTASDSAKPVANAGGRDWVNAERAKLREDALRTGVGQTSSPATAEDDETWRVYLTCMTAFIAGSLLAVMAACTALRTHLFIWTVFSPKYLYAAAWAVAWHLLVNCGLGSLLWWAGSAA